ncbi:family 43 glycosylhydrolase [Blautia hominis]|uniref:Family 43 glycosylhydrolase n=1 Tax=Blautia hominis TaxID=2025493 RepID=A0ABQ0BDG4_9FIRM
MKKHYCNPINLEYRYQCYRKVGANGEKGAFKVYREAADPSLVLFRDTYFLFPSMTAGFFTSDDLIHFEFHKFKGEIPIYDYAPDVRVKGEYLYFSASHMGDNCNFYRTKDPRTEPFEEVRGSFRFWDPNLFIDDDGRVYFYWGCSNQEPIYGVEMDSESMTPLTEKQEMFDSHPESRGYERFGNEHISPKSEEQIEAEVETMLGNLKRQSQEQHADIGMSDEKIRRMLWGYFGNKPYIEGAWMTKFQGKYYLQYAIPGTEYNIYGDGVYVADKPLGPFVPAKNNPYSYKPGGFITGAGHGSTLKDKHGNWWHTSTMRISLNEDFERRIGLWKAGFDDEGELYCDQRFGDWPISMDAVPFEEPDWVLLSFGKPVTASYGNGTEHVTDEDIQTYWQAGSTKPGEWVCVDLKKVYDVSAVQINFADVGVTRQLPDNLSMHRESYEERYIDQDTHVTQWLLEGSTDGENWTILKDKRTVQTDLAHDFLEWEEPLCIRYLRLYIEALPFGQRGAVSGIRVFGRGNGTPPEPAQGIEFKDDGEMDLDLTWSSRQAVGAVVLWGHTPEKLYHSRMVYGEEKVHIGALVIGEPVYIRVDTWNENGITEGRVIQVRE